MSAHEKHVIHLAELNVSRPMPFYCWLHFRGPQDMRLSVLLLEYSCVRKSLILVTESMGRPSEDTSSMWQSCQRVINPGPDYTTLGPQVYVGVQVKSVGTFSARLNIMVIDRQPLNEIQTRFVSPQLGYLQNFGIRLHVPFDPQFPNRVAHGYGLDVRASVSVPEDSLIMVSVACASFAVLPPDQTCAERVELSKQPNNSKVWTLCSHYYQVPSPRLVEGRTMTVRFVTAHKDAVRLEYDNKHGSGFRLLFSFHQLKAIPLQYANGTWDCSSSLWPDFQQHLKCNLITECAGGQDEKDCLYTLCGDSSFVFDGKCYSLHKAQLGISWHQASTDCSKTGARLAAPKTPAIISELARIFRLDLLVKAGDTVLVGARTSETDQFLYRNVFQWSDRTAAFVVFMRQLTGNTETMFGHLSPTFSGMVTTDFTTSWKLQKECERYFCSYLCEKTLPGNSDSGEGKANRQANVEVRTAPVYLNGSSIQFPYIQCPKGHITHTFLALDESAQCFDGDSQGRAYCDDLQHASSPFCRSILQLIPETFTCENGLRKVPYTLVCDFIRDCQDNSDEEFCVFPRCGDIMESFLCKNEHECIGQESKCDGTIDCTDNSDEIGQDCFKAIRSRFDIKTVAPPYLLELDTLMGFLSLEHLSSACPETHVQCPGDRNCIPVYLRCNGILDCSDREDEAGCSTYTCPGFYRCRGSQMCVHYDHLCNNSPYCPQHDDERFCSLNCSDSCVCFGHAFVCSRPFEGSTFPQLRYLDARGSGMKVGQVSNNSMLIFLSLAECNVTSLEKVSLANLVSLDLRDNKLNGIGMEDLILFTNLKNLHLAGNPIRSLFAESHSNSHAIRQLDISRIRVTALDVSVFEGFGNLQMLNLSGTPIINVYGMSVESLPKSLTIFDARGCPIDYFPRRLFTDLENLQTLCADNYKLCCQDMLPEDFSLDRCKAPFDEISSCEDLLRSSSYRISLSVLASLALLGNSISFITRIILQKGKSVSGFRVFVLHLCVSDFFMGVYLVFMGVADRMYQGRYLWKDTAWRHSLACKLAGFTSLASCEVSAFIICLITVDRFLVLRFPFSRMRFGALSAQVSSAAAWVTGCVLALIPLLPATSEWQFYSQTGICIPLPVTRKAFAGQDYSFGVMIVLNFILFMLIATGQVSVYVTIQTSKMSEADTSKKSQDATIALRLITVVLSDFLCWFPIGLLGILASSGIPIPGEVSVAMAIFILPLNSALNPFLYTLNMLQEHVQKRKEKQLFEKILQQNSQ